MVILVRGSAGPRTRTLAIPTTTGAPAADEEAGWEEGHILFGGDSSSSRLLRRLVLSRQRPRVRLEHQHPKVRLDRPPFERLPGVGTAEKEPMAPLTGYMPRKNGLLRRAEAQTASVRSSRSAAGA